MITKKVSSIVNSEWRDRHDCLNHLSTHRIIFFLKSSFQMNTHLPCQICSTYLGSNLNWMKRMCRLNWVYDDDDLCHWIFNFYCLIEIDTSFFYPYLICFLFLSLSLSLSLCLSSLSSSLWNFSSWLYSCLSFLFLP